MRFKVNANILWNVNLEVDSDFDKFDPSDPDAVKMCALAYILEGEFEMGDPVEDPKINWVEECDD